MAFDSTQAEAPARRITTREIKEQVARAWGIRVSDMDITERRRGPRQIAHARQEAMYRMQHELASFASLSWIGRQFGPIAMDHTTVHHGIQQHAERLKTGAFKYRIGTEA